MHKEYKSLIFTTHSLERLASRSITQEMVWQIVTNPTKKYPIHDNKLKLIGTVANRRLHVVVQRLLPEKKWLVISTWVRGENDPIPLVWRMITFPFWAVFKLISLLWNTLTTTVRK